MTPDAGSPVALLHGQADAAWLVDEGALLVVGAATAVMPGAARVLAADGGDAGSCRILSWQGENGGCGVLALLEVEHVAALRLDRVELVSEGGVTASLSIKRFALDPAPAVKCLAAAPAAALADVIDFLGTAWAEGDGRTARATGFVGALLAEISRPDGFVETIGPAEDGGTVIQGWSFHLRQGMGELIVETDRPLKRGGAIGVFDRPDLLSSALGIIGYFRGGNPVDPAAVRRVHYRTAEGYFHLGVAEGRTVLPRDKTVPHLRAALAGARCDAQTLRAFKRACRPRFEGQETISSFPAPVRAVVDLAVTVPDAGNFVCGWLLDPLHQVARVILRSTDGFYARIDDSWGRLQRPDVTQTFRADKLLGPAIGQMPADAHRHGFAVFVPRPNAARLSSGLWLEIVLHDDSCAFLPFSALDGTQEGVAVRLLTCLDPRDAATRSIVERHLAPASVAAARRTAGGGDTGEVVPIGAARRGAATPRLSIVLSAVDGAQDLDINLACLAGEPMAAAAELILVSTGGADSALADRADQQARFYGFAGRLAMVERAVGRHQALGAGARLATGEALLFLGPDVLPRGPGWLGALVRAFRASERAGLVSPTLLYEDDSIRFAGMPLDALAEDAAAPAGPGRHTGYPRHWITETVATEVLAGTSDCCLMPRGLFERVGGFARDLLGGAQQDVALGLRLRAIGKTCLWLPSVMLYAVDSKARAAAPADGVDIPRLIDAWSFARTWEDHRARDAARRVQ